MTMPGVKPFNRGDDKGKKMTIELDLTIYDGSGLIMEIEDDLSGHRIKNDDGRTVAIISKARVTS